MHPQIKTIVVGSSLSAASEILVADALALARLLGARLRAVHSFLPPIPLVGNATPTPWLSAEPFEAHTRQAHVELEAQLVRAGVRPEESAGSAVSMMPPHRFIVDEASKAGAQLIVVGASESRHRVQRLLGSTADRVLRLATCPVLVRRGELHLPPRRVIVPVDLSHLSAAAYRYARTLLGQLGSSSIEETTVLLVTLPDQRSQQFSSAQIERMAGLELERFIAAMGDTVPNVRPLLRVGDPVDEILAEMDKSRADLTILGSHGRGGFERHVPGSVASELARASSCSVLVVPPDTEAYDAR